MLEGLKLDYVERTAEGTSSETKLFVFPNSGLKLSGEEPAGGTASIDEFGDIEFAVYDKDKRWCAKKDANSEKIKMEDYSEENCKIEEASGEEVLDGTVVYFDPVAGTKCDTYIEANSAIGVKTGCMKFYTFGGNNNSEKVNLLLDHNTTAKVEWNTSGTNTEMKEAKVALETDTSGWIGNPRLITADEIAKITGHPTFNSSTTTSSGSFCFDTNTTEYDPNMRPGSSKYAWLFDRMSHCTIYGCNIDDNSTYGYWTSSAVSGSLSNVWHVSYYNKLSGDSTVSLNGGRGIRPVITVSKFNVS